MIVPRWMMCWCWGSVSDGTSRVKQYESRRQSRTSDAREVGVQDSGSFARLFNILNDNTPKPIPAASVVR